MNLICYVRVKGFSDHNVFIFTFIWKGRSTHAKMEKCKKLTFNFGIFIWKCNSPYAKMEKPASANKREPFHNL